MASLLMTIVETPLFSKTADTLDHAEKDELIFFLASHPESGKIIQGTGGVRKFRWSKDEKGKRGGYRVIYYFQKTKFLVFALLIYPKNSNTSLTKSEKSQLKRFVKQL